MNFHHNDDGDYTLLIIVDVAKTTTTVWLTDDNI